MKPSIIVVDMIEGNFRKQRDGSREEEKIIKPMKEFLARARTLSIPIIFACDSFYPQDFIFKGKLKIHALRGTNEVAPLKELGQMPEDIVVEKRRLSAFYKTDLDQTLRTIGIDTVAICGIQTQFCILATVFDALSNDFSAIILEDITASSSDEIHRAFLEPFRNSVLYPLLRVMKSEEFLSQL